MDNSFKKTASILEHIDQVVADIEKLSAEPDSAEKTTKLKSILFYWLGIVFEDGAADTENLKFTLNASKELIERLKISNETLRMQAVRSLKKGEEL